ncbi:hypothetical protein ABK040_004402 [Willaertia magna]
MQDEKTRLLSNDKVRNSYGIALNSEIQKLIIPQEDFILLEDVSKGEEEVYEIEKIIGLKFSMFWYILFWLLSVLSFGILLLFCYWFDWLKDWMVYYKITEKNKFHKDLSTFKGADAVMIKAKSTGIITFCEVKKTPIEIPHTKNTIIVNTFVYRYLTFIYDEEKDLFCRVYYPTLLPFQHVHEQGLTNASPSTERHIKSVLFGKNSIETPMKNILVLLFDEVLHPFYIFQVASVAIWCYEAYYIYAGAIAVISTLSALISLYETRENLLKLREMTSFHCGVNRLVNSSEKSTNLKTQRIDSTELVPGDLIEIDSDMTLPCDVILLHGSAILNESMLTGESTPTKKLPIPKQGTLKDIYNSKRDKSHTLFSGTQVILTKPVPLNSDVTEDDNNEKEGKVYGMVSKTGFQTAKGKLVLSILFPKPSTFQFYSDSIKFLVVMFLFGLCGISFSIYSMVTHNAPISAIIISCFDLLTTILPPSLIIALNSLITFAIARLKQKKIYCISPTSINVSGRVNLACFDKTNTLTMDGLDLHGVVPCTMTENESIFKHLVKDTDILSLETNPLFFCMACCHNLSYINHKLVGDPLDVKLFEATHWVLNEANGGVVIGSHNNEISFQVLKVFDFKSSLQRMSVVVKDTKSDDIYYFVKGSAEMLKTLSLPNSIPEDFPKTLYKYSHKGYRVLACGVRKITMNSNQIDSAFIDQLTREEVENELQFLGFICMENKLKRDTTSIIKTLNDTNLRSVVITGDNPYTTICVARKCGIVPKKKTLYLCEFDDNFYQNGDNNFSINTNYKESLNPHLTHYIPSIHDRIMWRNVDDQNAPLLTTKELFLKDYATENFELAVIGEIYDYILEHHKTYVKENNLPYVDTEYPSLLHRILASCQIYARTSPSGKMRVVEEMQKIDYFVVFCGDGSNDCEALKAAHVGVSLSEAEASIAAPFTSLKNSISSVVEIMKEGRSALSSSFQMFKYMALYSLFEFFAAVLIFYNNADIGDTQYLYIDMFIILPIVLFMPNSKSTEHLKKEKPPGTLISRFVFISLFSQIALGFGFMLMVFFLVMFREPWFKPSTVHTEPKENVVSFETTVTYLMCCYTVLNGAISQSLTKPFKRSLIRDNFPYVLLLSGLYLFTSYLVAEPCSWIRTQFQLIRFPRYFRYEIIGFALAHLTVSYLLEYLLLTRIVRKIIKSITILNFFKVLNAITSCFGGEGCFKYLCKKQAKRERLYRQLRINLGIPKQKERFNSFSKNV